MTTSKRDTEEPAINLVPPDETPKTATDPYVTIRKLTIYDESQQSISGQKKGGSSTGLELKVGTDSELIESRKDMFAREGMSSTSESVDFSRTS